MDLKILSLSAAIVCSGLWTGFAQEEDGEEPVSEETQAPAAARRHAPPGQVVKKVGSRSKEPAPAKVQGELPAVEPTAYEPAGEPAPEPQTGGSAITQDGSVIGQSGAGGGRQDEQSKAAAASPRVGIGHGSGSGGGRGGGRGGGPAAGKFKVVDIDKVGRDLGLPPGAAWAIRFKARRVGNPLTHDFTLQVRTGSQGSIRVKAAIASGPGVLNAAPGCMTEGIVQRFPSILTYLGGAPQGACALKEGGMYYYNVTSDGGCSHPDAIMRGCPALFSVSNGGMWMLAPDGLAQ